MCVCVERESEREREPEREREREPERERERERAVLGTMSITGDNPNQKERGYAFATRPTTHST